MLLKTSSKPSSNLIGIFGMLLSMSCLVINDVFVKLTSEELPIGQIIVIRGAFASFFIISFAAISGNLTQVAKLKSPKVFWRALGEGSATLFFLSALVLMPIADATAIMQIVPLVMTAAGALLFKEVVGWRRWAATLIGFIGVMIIIKPGSDSFQWASILALGAVFCVCMRDLVTRRIPSEIPTLLLASSTSVFVMLSGLLFLPFQPWQTVNLSQILYLALAALFLLGGYVGAVIGLRFGEIAVVSPFRYSIAIFAIIAGFLVWGDIPHWTIYLGMGMVIAAGIYTFIRELQLGIRKPYISKKGNNLADSKQ